MKVAVKANKYETAAKKRRGFPILAGNDRYMREYFYRFISIVLKCFLLKEKGGTFHVDPR